MAQVEEMLEFGDGVEVKSEKNLRLFKMSPCRLHAGYSRDCRVAERLESPCLYHGPKKACFLLWKNTQVVS